MNFKKILALLLAVIMVFSLAACGNSKGSDDDPVAKVGEAIITEGQLNQYMYLYAFLQMMDLSIATEDELQYIRTLVLEDYIALTLAKLEYMDDPDALPEDHDTAADDFVTNVGEQEQTADYMKTYNISDEYLREFYIDQYYSMTFFGDLTADIPDATEEEARAYFDENPDYFEIDEVTASHILVEEEELAEEILTKLKDGEDFAGLAKEYSIDGSAADGGSLGSFGRGWAVAPFEEAAFALQPGEMSDIVESQFGYHIILVTDKNQGHEDFESVKEDIKSTLYDEKVREAYTAKITELREKYGVEYLKAGYGDLQNPVE